MFRNSLCKFIWIYLSTLTMRMERRRFELRPFVGKLLVNCHVLITPFTYTYTITVPNWLRYHV